MRVPPEVAVGACTHTGYVRVGNEDDYLLGASPAPGGAFLGAIADGMGGVAGGAEASRTALRAMATAVLDAAPDQATMQRLEQGFLAAEQRVFETANAVPGLRDMGTTLTALCLGDGLATFAHIGDTRLYRRRAGQCELLTTDHAMRQPDNLLTRCIGGGQPHCEFDSGTLPTLPGDRFVLVTDGVWSVLPAGVFERLIDRGDPQAVAETLVAAALEAGGPDNATALVLDVQKAAPEATAVDVELPRDERPDDRDHWPQPVSLRPPLWPWLLLAAALALLAHEVLRRFDFDVFGGGW